MKTSRMILIGLAVSLAVGGALSLLASPEPDGLERVSIDSGFEGAPQPALRSPIPDYLFPGIRNERLATGLAGFLGTLVVFSAVTFMSIAIRKRKNGTHLSR
jgi:cobalt/nickel transport protein